VLKKEAHFLKNRMMEMQRGSGGTPNQEKIINEMFQELNAKESQV
jgi:hypothetical protein